MVGSGKFLRSSMMLVVFGGASKKHSVIDGSSENCEPETNDSSRIYVIWICKQRIKSIIVVSDLFAKNMCYFDFVKSYFYYKANYTFRNRQKY